MLSQSLDDYITGNQCEEWQWQPQKGRCTGHLAIVTSSKQNENCEWTKSQQCNARDNEGDEIEVADDNNVDETACGNTCLLDQVEELEKAHTEKGVPLRDASRRSSIAV